MSKNLEEVYRALEEIKEDNTVPRNVKGKMDEIAQILKAEDQSLGMNKALSELEFISNDVNMESFTRMQILQVISLLENLCA